MTHGDSLAPPVGRTAGDYRDGLVVRIVEHLNLESIARPVKLAHRIEHPLGHVALVVDRHLDADSRLASLEDRLMNAWRETS